MIYETLDQRITEAMLEEKVLSEKLKTNFWKGVKTEMVNAIHNGVKLPNDEAETKILSSMLKRCRTAIEEFSKAGEDNEIAMQNKKVNEFEAHELEQLLPKEASPEEVHVATVNAVVSFVAGKEPGFDMKTLQRYTKDIINIVKAQYPTANNGIIASVIKEMAH